MMTSILSYKSSGSDKINDDIKLKSKAVEAIIYDDINIKL